MQFQLLPVGGACSKLSELQVDIEEEVVEEECLLLLLKYSEW